MFHILLLYKDKAGFCLYALNKKTTQSIRTKLFLNDCGHNREGYRKYYNFNIKISRSHSDLGEAETRDASYLYYELISLSI